MSDRVFSWKTGDGSGVEASEAEMVLWQHSDMFLPISVKWLKLNPRASSPAFTDGTVKLSYTSLDISPL